MVIIADYSPLIITNSGANLNELVPIHKELIVLPKLIALYLVLPDVFQRDNKFLNHNVPLKVRYNIISHKQWCMRQILEL